MMIVINLKQSGGLQWRGHSGLALVGSGTCDPTKRVGQQCHLLWATQWAAVGPMISRPPLHPFSPTSPRFLLCLDCVRSTRKKLEYALLDTWIYSAGTSCPRILYKLSWAMRRPRHSIRIFGDLVKTKSKTLWFLLMEGLGLWLSHGLLLVILDWRMMVVMNIQALYHDCIKGYDKN